MPVNPPSDESSLRKSHECDFCKQWHLSKYETLLKCLSIDTKQPDPFHNPSLYEPYWFLDDPGSNNSGYYELQGVLSHQGRTSTSGHYVAWVKIQGMWFKLDDDVVSQVTSDDILRLSGGGDWHCAYFLLYGPRCVKKESMDSCDQPSANTETTTTTNGSSKSLADH
ncbi:unnamed protein product [Heterobilharzia americana]|nr:unnamed protein product [Heterobilharzia americana]